VSMIQANTFNEHGRLRWVPAVSVAVFLIVTGLQAAELEVVADQVACIPANDNAVVMATVAGDRPGTTVRLYFRRLNDVVEDLYFVNMIPSQEEGRYWGVLPKPERRKPARHEIARQRQAVVDANAWAEWWRVKEASDDRNPTRDLDDDKIRERASLGKHESRNWMDQLDDAAFQKWLENLEFEPVEYFVSVADPSRQVVAQTPMMIGEVRQPSSCHVELTPEQRGEAENLVVGETAGWQAGEPVFHWLCDGVVTRIGDNNIKRADESCRTCVPCITQAAILTNAVGSGVSPSGFE
jgi:hypothetical protein